MSTAISNISSIVGGVTPPPIVSASASTGNNSADSSASASRNGLPAFHSPRVIQDPSVGIITQYLSVNGSTVLTQTPDAITVAYLRNGLERDGTRKTDKTA